MSDKFSAPPHGFSPAEFALRLERARQHMAAESLDALVLTSPENFRYFSGFSTEFWQSPTRPWFLVIQRVGPPIAIVPEIGVAALELTWRHAIRSWPAPVPGDDGVSLLVGTLGEIARKFSRIGWELGREVALRMPVRDFERVRSDVRGLEFVDGSSTIWALRMIKSDNEIARIRRSCEIACDCFDALPARLALGRLDYEIAKDFRADLIRSGADNVPFLAVCGGGDGYEQIIVGPRGHVFAKGDMLVIDTGATYDGYYCDFDRNFAFGRPVDAILRANEDLWRATEEALGSARAGVRACDLHQVMAKSLEGAGYGAASVGRLGHGLGMQLTEPPSHMPGDQTCLAAGMVLTIEPGVTMANGKMLVHEENIAITDDGFELLTRRAPRELPVID